MGGVKIHSMLLGEELESELLFEFKGLFLKFIFAFFFSFDSSVHTRCPVLKYHNLIPRGPDPFLANTTIGCLSLD